jgi:uncharacterized protein YyaL (SSP411 family)
LKAAADALGNRLVSCYRANARGRWRWFEDTLTYDNARLPQALTAAYTLTGKQQFLDVAQQSLGFLLELQMLGNVFVPVGNAGWCNREGKRAFYDQQPIEAAATVDAALDVYGATADVGYLHVAEDVFGWFLGVNSAALPLYDSESGGCRDGLSPVEVNSNMGAESSVCYLLARLRLEEAKQRVLVVE